MGTRLRPPAARSGCLLHDPVGDEGGEGYGDGKGNLVAGHGLCAVPKTHGRTGRKTFVTNIQGTVFEKDTGGEPVDLFPDLTAEGWEIAQQPPPARTWAGGLPGQHGGAVSP